MIWQFNAWCWHFKLLSRLFNISIGVDILSFEINILRLENSNLWLEVNIISFGEDIKDKYWSRHFKL